MKKLLIMLMVVAMASFLFVGCLGVTPPIDDEDEEDGPVLPTSTPPTIFDIQDSSVPAVTIVDVTATGTEYINKDEAGDFIQVVGIATGKALVKVYIGTALLPVNFVEAGATGIWTVAIATDKLGVDGAKTLYATATEVALEESASSNVVKFTLDTAAPTIKSVVGDITLNYITVNFSEAVIGSTVLAAIWNYEAPALSTPLSIVTTITVVSSTVARLDAIVGDPLLVTDMTVSVKPDALVKDSAGNPIVPVTVYGFVY